MKTIITKRKNFITNFLSYASKYKEYYTDQEKDLIVDFLDVLQFYHIDNYPIRQELEQKITQYNNQIQPTIQYQNTPFLWFVVDYLTQIKRLLNKSQFSPSEIFKFMSDVIRGYEKTRGVFDLLKEQTPLNSLKWEELQYAINKLHDPLSQEEIQVLTCLYSYMSTTRLNALNQQNINRYLASQLNRRSIKKYLTPLFTRIGAEWVVLFNPYLIKLLQVRIILQLNEKISIQKLFRLPSQENGILNQISIFKIHGSRQRFYLSFNLPQTAIPALEHYLEELESKQKIRLETNLERIESYTWTYSLNQYIPNKGWKKWNTADYYDLTQLMLKHKTHINENDLTFHSKVFDNNGSSYSNRQIPALITLIKKFKRQFSYHQLPFGKPSSPLPITITKAENQLLKELIRNQQAQILFHPKQLVIDYSIDDYQLRIPKQEAIEQLPFLLRILPYTFIRNTQKSSHITCPINSSLASWLQEKLHFLNWKISPGYLTYVCRELDHSWFDTTLYEWKIPEIFKEYQ